MTTRTVITPRSGAICIACGGKEISRRGYSVAGLYPLVRCDECGMQFLEIPELPNEDFDEYWDESAARVYQAPDVVDELKQKYRRYFGLLAARAPNRRFLDVGSGAGIGLYVAKTEFGFDTLGIEPSARAVHLARERLGANVIQGLLGPDCGLDRDFGALTLWDVIEHVENPEALLQLCADHLVDGGVFLLETPDQGALLRRIVDGLGRLHVQKLDLRGSIYYRAHRYYFTRRALHRLLERCGFVDIRFHAEHSMYQKELQYMEQYGTASKTKKFAVHLTANFTRWFPALGNKMVVTAVKATGS